MLQRPDTEFTLEMLHRQLRRLADPDKARFAQRYFKTGPGEYAAGDRFLGIRVPALRKLAREFRDLADADILALLQSDLHEERLLALLLWVDAYRRGDTSRRQFVYDNYVANTAHINHWDLVDTSAEHIVGAHLWQRPRDPLYRLVRSNRLWERRIAVLASFHFIKRNQYADTLELAALLLDDPHELIHKATGWMLREIAKRDFALAEQFLRSRYRQMPRTMLRYAIERYPEPLRQDFLQGRA